MADTMERTPVVTAFLYSGEKIALVKRSDKVGTYRGSWAGFSGYVEMLPLDQACLELAEEAGVERGESRLMGIGLPVPVDDKETGHRWLVFPFLFELSGDMEVKTDWEASEWGWFAPGEISGLKTVPGLDTALGRVWPPFADREFWRGLGSIASDQEHGATELARRGLDVLGRFVQDRWDQLDHDGLMRAVRAFAASRPSMGVFPDLASRLILGMEREGGQYEFDVLISELKAAVDDATDLSVRVAAQGLSNYRRIFTLSYSETVRETILAWYTADSEVIIAESDPGKEGLLLAEYLAERDVPVRTIVDSNIETVVREVDAVFVGCDAITEENEVQNKAGTRTAVLAAQAAGVPAYAVTQTFKITPPNWPRFLEQQSAVVGKQDGAIFDLTPLSVFTEVFTEEGTLDPGRLEELRAELASVELVPGT